MIVSRWGRRWAASWPLLLILGGGAEKAVAQEVKTCALAECVQLALEHQPELAGKEAAVEAAEAAKKAARGHYGPKVMASGSIQYWDDELVAQVGDFDAFLPGLDIPPMVVRHQFNWQASITVAQPLTGLWQIYEANQLAAIGVDLARLEHEAAEIGGALKTTQAWLQAVLAEAMIGISENSIQARQSDRERAEALVRRGVLVENDLLRAELGVTQAQQSLAQAQRQSRLAHAHLSQLVGFSVSPAVEDVLGGTEGRPLPELKTAQATALERRIELTVLEKRLAQAQGAVDLAWSKMLPEVNLVGQVQFSRPSTFGDSTMAFGGLTFDWTLWEWGATRYGIDEAKARVREVEAGMQQLRDGIALEVESAWINAQSALDQATLASAAKEVAEKHYEFIQKRFEHKAATSFDLVTAEAELTKARADERLAWTNGFLARAQLASAMGLGAEAIAKEGTP